VDECKTLPQGMLRAIFPSAVAGSGGSSGGTHAHGGGHVRVDAERATATVAPGVAGAPVTSLQVGVISAVGTAVLAASVVIYSRLCWSEAEDLAPRCDYGMDWLISRATPRRRHAFLLCFT